MILDKLINEKFSLLNDNDLHIIGIINQQAEEVQTMKIQTLASLCHTSISSIHRVCKKLGFDGYTELKTYIKMNDPHKEETHDLIQIMEHDIDQTYKHLDQLNFQRLNELIDNASYIYIYGTGSAQQFVAHDLQRQLMALFKRTVVLRNVREVENILELTTEEDLFIFISLSGETKNIIDTIKLMNSRNMKSISITTLSDNTLAQHANFNIYVNSTSCILYNGLENSSFLPFYIAVEMIVKRYSMFKEDKIRKR